MSQVVEPQAEGEKPFGNDGKLYARASWKTHEATPVASMLNDFAEHFRALKRSESTITITLKSLKHFFRFIDASGIDLRAVSLADVVAYKASLVNQKKYAPATVDAFMRAVLRLYKWLERVGKVLVDPTSNLELPRIKSDIPKAVMTVAEVKRLLDAPDTTTLAGIRDKTMLELFYSTGIRLSELCALTVYDVDTVNRYIRINSGKGGKDRVVPMGRKASLYLKDYLKNVRGVLTTNRRDERALFVGDRGGPIHLLIVERKVKDYARQARINKRVTPHTLRHTCATHMMQAGADVTHAQRLLGHNCITTTQIYTRVAAVEVKKTHHESHPTESRKMPDATPRLPKEHGRFFSRRDFCRAS